MAETKMRAVMSNETRKIVEASRNPEKSFNNTFIIDGKSYKFQEAQNFSDEELANAIVVDRFGYYLRRGLQDVSKSSEFRQSCAQDWVKEEYKATIDYEEVDADEEIPPIKRTFMENLKYKRQLKELKKSQSTAKKIIADARDPQISSTLTFVIDGKEYSFNRAQSMSDEQLANAIVVDRDGYYIRRGLQNVTNKHERRHSSSQDWVSEEYRYKGEE